MDFFPTQRSQAAGPDSSQSPSSGRAGLSQALRGVSYQRGVQMMAPAAAVVQMREGATTRGRTRGQGEFDRRTPGDHASQDGSGEHGRESAGLTDYANRAFWLQVADTAEAMGMTNAARHMRHYLYNSGSQLNVNVDHMFRDMESFRGLRDREVTAAHQLARTALDSMETPTVAFDFPLPEGAHRNHYCTRAETADWYFAIGGYTYWHTATAHYAPNPATPGSGTVTVRTRIHIFDRYNWDQGKQVEIAGVTVRDEQLGRLHTVGLAQEFEVHGQSSEIVTTFPYTRSEAPDTLMTQTTEPHARAGGRTDPGRPTQ